jgi:signal transduction histidine kinase
MTENSENCPTAGVAKMRPRARLISLIGEELISDECVALVELVKNSYDADATHVALQFSDFVAGIPKELSVTDDGCGMSVEVVLGSWFEPGTIAKKSTDRSAKGRVYQGAKGVGRFAAARLSKSLYMETKQKGADTGVVVLVDWGCFDDMSYLDDVEMTYEVVPLPHIPHGTKMTLIGLNEEHPWSETDFASLHERLSRLISPFAETEDFKISLEIQPFPELTGEVEPHPLTQSPKYHLSGYMNDQGQFTGAIKLDGISIKEYAQHNLARGNESVSCGGFQVDIRAWDRDRDGLSPYMLKYDMTLTGVRNLIRAYSGVSIYRDGFRVHPYGESGNDWLELDNRSRQNPTMRLANNQVIAAIRISRGENPELRDRTTREGLVHNNAYVSLRDWFERILKLLEEERYRARPREAEKPGDVRTVFSVFDLSTVVDAADRQLGKQHPVSVLVRKSDADIREGVVRLQEHYSRLLMTAGLGQLVDLVIHEIGAPVARALREVAHLQQVTSNQLDMISVETIDKGLQKTQAWLEQIVSLRNRLDPKAAGRRGRSSAFDVREEIEGNLQLFENLIAKQKIRVQIKGPPSAVVVKMTRSVLGQVLANLLDNSVFWLTRHHGDGNGGNISIALATTQGGFEITFCDDGPGVAESDRERIFDPYFTTKPNGMGLGLYVARQVMERYGRLFYCDSCEMPGACFVVSFERNVGL